MIVNTYEEYTAKKMAFIKKHNGDWRVETSPMDEYGVYYKTYLFEDGAVWYERMSPKYEKVQVEVKRVKTTVEVKLFETEFWSTESGSELYYERF